MRGLPDSLHHYTWPADALSGCSPNFSSFYFFFFPPTSADPCLACGTPCRGWRLRLWHSGLPTLACHCGTSCLLLSFVTELATSSTRQATFASNSSTRSSHSLLLPTVFDLGKYDEEVRTSPPSSRKHLTASRKSPISRSSRAPGPTVDRPPLTSQQWDLREGRTKTVSSVFCQEQSSSGERAFQFCALPLRNAALNCPLRSSVRGCRHDRQPCLKLVHARSLTFVLPQTASDSAPIATPFVVKTKAMRA